MPSTGEKPWSGLLTRCCLADSVGESIRRVVWRQQIGAPGRGDSDLNIHISHIFSRRTMARKSQNRSINASRRSSRLMERGEPEDASTGPPAPIERANDELLSQLVQQVQRLTAAIQDLRQPTDLPPPLEEPAFPSRHSRRSRPDPRSGRHAPHSRLERQSTRLR